jgi:hypothetical protein
MRPKVSHMIGLHPLRFQIANRLVLEFQAGTPDVSHKLEVWGALEKRGGSEAHSRNKR